MNDFPLYDDVGSFPLPPNINYELFQQFYWTTYKALLNTTIEDVFNNSGIRNYFITPFLDSFQFKQEAGVQIINYPQHIDMYNQFLNPLKTYEIEPGFINADKAIIPEGLILNHFAKQNYTILRKPLNIKLCITGPLELYIKNHSFTIYNDLALNYSKTVNSFLKNSIFNSKYIKTSIVAIDEPSFGFVNLFNVSNDDLITILDKSLEQIDCTTQIHLHTLNQAEIPLQTEHVDVLTCEYASDHTNVISKNRLDSYDKFIRVGITRTNIDNICAEALDRGVSQDELKTLDGRMQLIDSEQVIEHNLTVSLDHYKERLMFVGPDCGLASWTPPELAYSLLKRTSKVISRVKNNQ